MTPFATFDGKDLYPTDLEKAIRMSYLLVMNHPFIDGNKRVGMLFANKIMIENGNGIIKVPDNKLEEFNVLLSEFYSTNKKEKIKQFIFDNCIDGITFEEN